MRKLLQCLAIAGTWVVPATAQQCLQMLNCPQGLFLACDYSDNDSALWHVAPYTWSPVLGSHDLYEGTAELTVKALACPGAGPVTVNYTLYLDLDNDNLEETVVQSTAFPPPGYVMANNAFNPGFTGGDSLRFDRRNLPDSLHFRFGLQTVQSGDTIYGYARWLTASNPALTIFPRMPEGKHRMVWSISQNGVTRFCQYSFRIKDCLKPTLLCRPGLTVPIDTATHQGVLAYQDALLTTADNITPTNLLELAVRRANTGTGFPLDSMGGPQQEIRYFCTDVGPQTAELWVRDRSGNVEFCTVNVIVAADAIACPPTQPVFCAAPYCNPDTLIPAVQFIQKWALPDVPIQIHPLPTEPSGCGRLDYLPPSGSFSIEPYKNNDVLNGVSTLDLVLMSKHILAVQPLDAPWKLIAADVNNNGAVTTFDIVELRRMLLGMSDTFTNNTSWRFFMADCTFPSNPFDGWCPSQITLATMPFGEYAPSYHFLGLKVGDVNASAGLDSLAVPAAERRTLYLTMPDLLLKGGEEILAPVQALEEGVWEGLQAEWQFDPARVSLEGVETGLEPGPGQEEVVVHPDGRLVVSWARGSAANIKSGAPLFYVRVRARETVRIKDVVRLQTNRLKPEVYPANAQVAALELVFLPETAGAAPLIWPNPASGAVTVQPAAEMVGPVRLELWDMAGRCVYVAEQAGATVMQLPAAAFQGSGLYVCRVVAESQSWEGKILHTGGKMP